MIKFRCSKCKRLLGGEDKQAGLVVRCPKCKAKTRVPKPGEAAPVQKLDELEVVEEEDFEIVDEQSEVVEEVDLAAFEEEERQEKARRTSRRPADDEDDDRPRKKPRRPIDDDEDDRPRRNLRRAVDEDEDEDDEDDDRPRRRSERGRRGRRRREAPAEFFSRNRISGLAGVLLGVFALIFGIAGFFMFDSLYYPIAALVLGVLFLFAGVIYMIIG
jgi:phage FluMu protein Com